ncbi:flagellin [Izhakiella australiensis]|uniref:Flagellin n=1 Tax=Izhakiella australiensis TaxID=1926881 RepID=A0A1S8YIK9_9GAMM|nr:flagellin [Izhakiella australiensis]OON38765.1 flagellin [Izhakiella australiensis]
MLSIFTNSSAMTSTNAMNRANNLLQTAMERLGTGKRINSAADDAAGLQIATRLQGQSNGMAVAQQNIGKATSMLQTAEGAFDEVTNILYRMKDLATQGADDTNSDDDRKSIQSEFGELNKELKNIMNNTSYGSEKLLASGAADDKDSGGGKPSGGGDTPATANGGKLTTTLHFQIGAGKDEVLNLDVSKQLSSVTAALDGLGAEDGVTTGKNANNMIGQVSDALNQVSEIRSSLGANINRLGHTSNNLANMKDNTDNSLGVIRDTDYAAESSQMTRQQMLAQSSQMMLKQANSMSGMVMSFLG